MQKGEKCQRVDREPALHVSCSLSSRKQPQTSKTTVTIRNMETAEPKGQSRASSSPTVLHSSVREPGGKTSGTKK